MNFQVLIIGCGNIAGGMDTNLPQHIWPHSHAGAYSRHQGFEIHACVDPDEVKSKTFARNWDVGLHATDLSCLRRHLGNIDVVSICSPTILHYDHVMQAIELQPKVIFCEKPLASNVTSSKKMLAACESHKIALAVNYSRQWDPSTEMFIQDISSGRWGHIRSIVGHYNKGILHNGSHMINLLYQLVGDLELVTVTSSSLDFWEDDPTTAALLTAINGKIPVYLSPSHANDFTFFELEIVCELGVIRMQSGGLKWEVREVNSCFEYNEYKTLIDPVITAGRYPETMSCAIDEIYNFIV